MSSSIDNTDSFNGASGFGLLATPPTPNNKKRNRSSAKKQKVQNSDPNFCKHCKHSHPPKNHVLCPLCNTNVAVMGIIPHLENCLPATKTKVNNEAAKIISQAPEDSEDSEDF
jgi:hypothetical protein